MDQRLDPLFILVCVRCGCLILSFRFCLVLIWYMLVCLSCSDVLFCLIWCWYGYLVLIFYFLFFIFRRFYFMAVIYVYFLLRFMLNLTLENFLLKFMLKFVLENYFCLNIILLLNVSMVFEDFPGDVFNHVLFWD